MRFEKYLIILFTVIIIPSTWEYICTIIKDFYFFNTQLTYTTLGKVEEISKINDLQGARSYTYYVEYTVNDFHFKLKELLSPDSLAVNVGDEVLVKYVPNNPAYATLKDNTNRWSEIGMVSVLVGIEIILICHVFKILCTLYINFKVKNKIHLKN